MVDSPFLYPNVSSVPTNRTDSSQRADALKKQQGQKTEFDGVLDQALKVDQGILNGTEKNLDQLKEPLKFSAHASQRLSERRIKLDAATLSKVTDAIDKADAKGVEDTLVLTADAALIVNVKNRTVITAMDKNSMNGNVFTNIDGAIIV